MSLTGIALVTSVLQSSACDFQLRVKQQKSCQFLAWTVYRTLHSDRGDQNPKLRAQRRLNAFTAGNPQGSGRIKAASHLSSKAIRDSGSPSRSLRRGRCNGHLSVAR